MDEKGKNDSIPVPHEPQKTLQEPLRFFWRDWLILGSSLALALLFFSVFDFARLSGLPGLGITLFVFALFLSVFLCLGRRAHLTISACLLCCSTLALSLTFCLYGDDALRILNCFIVLGLGAVSIFQLSGQAEKTWKQAGVLWEAVRLAMLALFSHVDKPFRALAGLAVGERKHMSGAMLGLLVALPILLVVLILLSSADEVFRSLFQSLFSWLEEIEVGWLIWRAIRTAALMLLLFSAFYFLLQPRPVGSAAGTGAKRAERAAPSSISFAVVLTLLNLVYIIFVAIQFAYLFGGEQAAAMKGGWAEYARSGFFQLVAVAIINLAAVLITASGGTDNLKKDTLGRRILLALAALLLLLTAVILFSALWRMGLYISVYGLSLLRALTLWGIVFLAVCLLAAALRLFRPGFRFFPVFFAAALILWLSFSFANIDRRIADYNVSAWLSGRVEQIDTAYLTYLGPDTLPPLKRLNAADSTAFSDTKLQAFEDGIKRRRNAMTWREWNLSLR